jgi:P4 family phage/plasmid primase-like protien
MTLQDNPLDFNDVPPVRKGHTSRRMSVARVAELLNDRIADLAVELLGTPSRALSTAQQLRFRTKGSIAVEIAGKDAGRWYDHEAGTGGAGPELIRHHLGMDEKAAWDWARHWLGDAEMPAARTAAKPATTKPAKAPASGPVRPVELTDAELAGKVAEIVRQTEVPNGTPANAYLVGRGIAIQPPDCIRFRRNAYGSYGAMVSLATDAAGEVLAIQQVYLTAEGKKAKVNPVKRTNKAVEGWGERSAVRLPGREPLVLCEGVETALSVWQATGQEVWACLGVSNIGRAPVSEKAMVIIARDGDAPGSKAEGQILRAASSLAARGITVQMAAPPEGEDFNDILVREGEDAVRSRIAAAEPFRADQAETRRKDLYIGSDVEIAKRVREDLTARHGRIVYAEGAFWRYIGTEWEAIEDHLIRLPVHAYDGADFITAAGEASRVKLNKSRVDSVLNECAALCAEPHFFENPPAGINCASGFIRFDASGTPYLEPHHRNHRCRHTLPGNWHPGMPSTPPNSSLLHRLLTGSFKGDLEAQAKCDLLAEVCGSAALGYATRLLQPRAVVLHGKTAENGKSQILQLARGLLPDSAICCVPAAKMGDERHVTGLVGKLLNASDELSPEAIASDTFKSVVTGEPIEGRDVYKSRVEFRSVAQNLFAANHLPSFKGGVDRGVQRRLLLIPFTRTIPLEERIEDIGKRIASDEADLLLAWAVHGAARLIRQRNFTIPESCRLALIEWVLGEDPVLAWIDACVRVQPIVNGGPMLATRDAYMRFQNWAQAEGFKPEKIPAINGFVQRVQAQVPGIQHKRTSAGRFFLGITVTQG